MAVGERLAQRRLLLVGERSALSSLAPAAVT